MGDDDPYSIPHTNILKNKLGITSAAQLDKAERLMTSVRVGDIPKLKSISLAEYQNIHKILFQDIYQWAGQARHQMPIFTGIGTQGFKSLSEGLQDIDKTLKGLAFGIDQLALASLEQFAEVAASVFCVINKAHIFREGNGRAQRVFLAKLAERVGFHLDIQLLSGPAWNIASMLACSGDKSYLQEQIQFSLASSARQAKGESILQKLEAKDRLFNDYQNIEKLAHTQNCASFEYNADKLVTQIVATIGHLDKIKGRFNVHIPNHIPQFLMAQVISSQVE